MKTLSNQTKLSLANCIVAFIIFFGIFLSPLVTFANQGGKDVPILIIEKQIAKEIKGQSLNFQFSKEEGKTQFKATLNCNFCVCELLKIKSKLVFSTNFSQLNFDYIVLGKTLKYKNLNLEFSNIT